MKFKKIGTRMLASILPVVIVAFLLVAIIAAKRASTMNNNQVNARMLAQCDATTEYIDSTLSQVSVAAQGLSQGVASISQLEDSSEIEDLLIGSIRVTDTICGCGAWFEPNAFTADQEYFGPYAYLDGDDSVVTYDYSNADYDYFSQDYYTTVSTGFDSIFTEPYYDETSGITMVTCAAPFFGGDPIGFQGCVTVDIDLTSMQEIIDSIQLGDNGYAMLISADGTYLAGVDDSLLQSQSNILEDENSSLAEAGQVVLGTDFDASSSGDAAQTEADSTSFTQDGAKYQVYYAQVDTTGWILMLCMPEKELTKAIHEMTYLLILVALLATVACVIVVVYQVRYIS